MDNRAKATLNNLNWERNKVDVSATLEGWGWWEDFRRKCAKCYIIAKNFASKISVNWAL